MTGNVLEVLENMSNNLKIRKLANLSVIGSYLIKQYVSMGSTIYIF